MELRLHRKDYIDDSSVWQLAGAWTMGRSVHGGHVVAILPSRFRTGLQVPISHREARNLGPIASARWASWRGWLWRNAGQGWAAIQLLLGPNEGVFGGLGCPSSYRMWCDFQWCVSAYAAL